MQCHGYHIAPFRARSDIIVTVANVNYDIYRVNPHEILKIESVVLSQISGTGATTLIIRVSEGGVITDIHTAITALDDGGKNYADAFWLRFPAILQAGLLSTVADDKVRVTFDGYRFYKPPMV